LWLLFKIFCDVFQRFGNALKIDILFTHLI
jgi:hypothetical protein